MFQGIVGVYDESAFKWHHRSDGVEFSDNFNTGAVDCCGSGSSSSFATVVGTEDFWIFLYTRIEHYQRIEGTTRDTMFTSAGMYTPFFLYCQMARTGSKLVGRLLLVPNVSDFAEVLLWPSFTAQWAFGFHGFFMKRDAHNCKTLYANAVLSCDVDILWFRRNTSVSCCQGRDHVPRECGVHDVGKYSIGSRIKWVFPDRNIITVAERFHCAVSAAEFYAILSPGTGKCDAVILLVAVQPFCWCPSLAALSSCRYLPLRSIYLLSHASLPHSRCRWVLVCCWILSATSWEVLGRIEWLYELSLVKLVRKFEHIIVCMENCVI